MREIRIENCEEGKLLPCPFCGRHGYYINLKAIRVDNWYCLYSVDCDYCGATHHAVSDKEYAIQKWNKRKLVLTDEGSE